MILKKTLLILAIFCNASWLFADPISVQAIHEGASITRDRQLLEFHQAFRPGITSYFDLGLIYTPLSTQFPLETPFGVHDGFAFRHHLNLFLVKPSLLFNSIDVGALWWMERHGWDTQDFLFFPAYEKFSFVRSVQTAGLTASYSKLKLGAALGIQYQNVERTDNIHPDESDSLYFWGDAYWNKIAIQTSFYKTDWRHFRVAFDLESKAILGGASEGWKTYLPNFDVAFFNGEERDSVKITWEQNLYKQMLYSRIKVFSPNKRLYSASLSFYPDPSRLFSLEASVFRKENGDYVFGGGLELPFLRVAYNQAYDIENFFGAHGSLIVEFRFALSSLGNQFLGLNAAKSAPMEENKKKFSSEKNSAPFEKKGESK